MSIKFLLGYKVENIIVHENHRSRNIGQKYLRFLFAIPIILIGSFLIRLTIDDIGDKGNVIMDIMGWIIFLVAIWIGRKKQVRKKQSS